MFMLEQRRPWLLILAAALSVVAIEACSDSDTSTPEASAGSGGKTQGMAGSGGTGVGQIRDLRRSLSYRRARLNHGGNSARLRFVRRGAETL